MSDSKKTKNEPIMDKDDNKSKKIIGVLACILVIVIVVFAMIYLSGNNDSDTTTTAPSTQAQATEATQNQQLEETTEDTSEESTQENEGDETTAEVYTPAGDSGVSLSVEQALDALDDFYGKTYDVNATIVEDGYQYFAVYDKRGTKYASVKVNLATSDAFETIMETGEVNEFNLADYANN